MIGGIASHGEKWSAGIAYIALPTDVDRDTYLKDCYLRGQVSIKHEDGSFENRVPIDQDTLNFIKFPSKATELGTAVVYILEPIRKQPIIIARLNKNDELGDKRENFFSLRRTLQNKIITIDGDVDKGSLYIGVKSEEQQGKLKIHIDNNDQNSILDIEVAGLFKLTTSDQTLIQNENSFESRVSSYEDSSKDPDNKPSVIRQDRNRTQITNKELYLNGKDISAIHYKGYKIAINDNGITIDALDKSIDIQAGDSKIAIDKNGIQIEGQDISINGEYEVLYNTIPGTPIAHVSQIGSSKTVKVGM